MSSTVLRVKRRLEDNRQDALVLMCKRIKTGEEEISPSLFVFRGTVENEETTQVKSVVPKIDSKFNPAHNIDDIIQKIRKERKEQSLEDRYEIVNCLRGIKEEENKDADIFDLIDLQQKSKSESEDVQYAYDLYTAAKQDFDISMLDNLVSIENYETDLIFGSYRDNGRQTPSSDGADDDDDSNDENNWRNDYPDSDPENDSIDEDDMIRAVEKCNIEDDLSSDTGEDQIYDELPNVEDVKRYGQAYASYKARVLSEEPDLASGLVHSVKMKDLDEEDLEGYKNDDSDNGFYYGQEEDTEQFKEQYANISSEEYDPD